MFGLENNELEGSRHHLTEILPWHLPGGSEEDYKKPQSGQPMSCLRFKLSTFEIQV
jgi:hypothetical protein